MTIRARSFAAVALCAGATAAFVAIDTSPASGGGLALLLAAFAGYAGFLRWQPRARALSGPLVLAISGALLVTAVAFPPRASNDYEAYAAYGRIVAEYHANPYRNSPSHYRDDPVMELVDPVWYRSRTVYGPLFTGISAAAMAVFSTSFEARLFFQSIAAIAMFGVLLLLWRRTRDPSVVGLVGLHPITSASIVNGAHNDALVGLAVLCGVMLIAARRDVAGGLALALGALVKIVGLFPLVAAAWWIWRRRGWRAAARVFAPAIALFAAAYAFVGPLDAMRALNANAHRTTAHSIARWLGPRVTEGAADAADLVRAAAIGMLVLASVYVLLAARTRSLPVTAGVGLLAYVLVAAFGLPWYVAWILPVLALDPRSLPTRVTIAMGALLMIVYLPVEPGAGARLLLPFARTGMPLVELALVVIVGVALRARARPGPGMTLSGANQEPSNLET